MPLFNTLLDRAQKRAAGIYVSGTDPATIVERWPVEERAWGAWRDAHVALSRESYSDASHWLHQAEESLSVHPDLLCDAEIEAAWLDLYDRIEEPRPALSHARKAWEKWFTLASRPTPQEWMPSLRTLLHTLAPDSTALPSDGDLLREWMLDRLAGQMQHVFKSAVRLLGTLHIRDGADAIVAQMQGWMTANMKHLPEQLRVVSEADVLVDVGNLYDAIGELPKSFEAFSAGVSLLDRAIEHPQVEALRARLRFNAANELARMKEHERAAAMFDEIRRDFLRQHMTEPALRAQHASLVCRWHAGTADSDALLRELEELITAYEQRPDGVSDRALRQNLDAAYRLWLMLVSPRITGNELLTHRLLSQLYALREGLTTVVSSWPRDLKKAPTIVLSEIAVLVARLTRHDDTVLLVLETGVDALVLTTIRGGPGALTDRVRSAVAPPEFAEAMEVMLREHGAATDGLVRRTIPARTRMSQQFLSACRSAWDTIPADVRVELQRASRLIVAPSNIGNIDELPVELWHDGAQHIGLTKEIVRAVSLKQLNQSLSENVVNVERTGSALLVLADDPDGAGALEQAAPEIALVREALEKAEVTPRVMEATTASALLEALGAGHDVFHYVGHGVADELGEQLLLGGGEAVSAVALMSLRPAPAPVCVSGACLVGRARHLQSGFQRGIAVALLSRGAPAVVAATQEVPDLIGEQFADAFYRHASQGALGAAMLAARKELAARGLHPSAWASFTMFGSPRATLLREHVEPRWPGLLLRLAATGSPRDADAARDAVAGDVSLSPAEVARVVALVDAFVHRDSAFFTRKKRTEDQGLSHDAEAYLAYRMLLLVGDVRFHEYSAADRETAAAGFVALWNKVGPMLHDSYLSVAAAIAALNDSRTYFTSEGRRIIGEARAALRWLSADTELSAASTTLSRKEVWP